MLISYIFFKYVNIEGGKDGKGGDDWGGGGNSVNDYIIVNIFDNHNP